MPMIILMRLDRDRYRIKIVIEIYGMHDVVYIYADDNIDEIRIKEVKYIKKNL